MLHGGYRGVLRERDFLDRYVMFCSHGARWVRFSEIFHLADHPIVDVGDPFNIMIPILVVGSFGRPLTSSACRLSLASDGSIPCRAPAFRAFRDYIPNVARFESRFVLAPLNDRIFFSSFSSLSRFWAQIWAEPAPFCATDFFELSTSFQFCLAIKPPRTCASQSVFGFRLP